MIGDDRSVSAIAADVRERRRSARAVTEECLERIERLDPTLGCFQEVYAAEAIDAAVSIDRRVAAGDDPGVLAGVPLAIKDNIAAAPGHTSCGSRMLGEYRSPYTATAVRRLIAAGAIVVGRTRCDEFAMGSSTEHCAFGHVHNPWDTTRVPGGSSGGSAAAVAARLCPAALGSETGGSIRQPAALCGIVGVKPSYGRVSRYGLVAFGSSLDQIGPLGCTVADVALLLRVMAGADPSDSTCSDSPVPDYPAALDEPVGSLRIGLPRQFLAGENDPAVDEAVRRAVDVYRGLGARIVELDLPLTRYCIPTYYVIAPAEASSNLARYDGIRYGFRAQPQEGDNLFDLYARTRAEGFGPEVKRRIMLGTYVLSAGYYEAYYRRAMQVRRLIRRELDAAFERCEAIIGPTTPAPAFRLGEKADPLSMYLCDLYTVGANLAGSCAISVGAGFAVREGAVLPVGLQVQCRPFDEVTMFRVARAFERCAGLEARLPPSCAGREEAARSG
jgi:aspartyl-tRNA(Asn)/glutamyl-tRNA(Gln) amidotransferase subunit A